LSTLSQYEIAFILKIMTQAECASAQFYAMIDKYIGNHLLGQTGDVSPIDPTLIYPILKSFYDSGKARAKLFIKMQ
jgi:hypothetical protein